MRPQYHTSRRCTNSRLYPYKARHTTKRTSCQKLPGKPRTVRRLDHTPRRCIYTETRPNSRSLLQDQRSFRRSAGRCRADTAHTSWSLRPRSSTSRLRSACMPHCRRRSCIFRGYTRCTRPCPCTLRCRGTRSRHDRRGTTRPSWPDMPRSSRCRARLCMSPLSSPRTARRMARLCLPDTRDTTLPPSKRPNARPRAACVVRASSDAFTGFVYCLYTEKAVLVFSVLYRIPIVTVPCGTRDLTRQDKGTTASRDYKGSRNT